MKRSWNGGNERHRRGDGDWNGSGQELEGHVWPNWVQSGGRDNRRQRGDKIAKLDNTVWPQFESGLASGLSQPSPREHEQINAFLTDGGPFTALGNGPKVIPARDLRQMTPFLPSNLPILYRAPLRDITRGSAYFHYPHVGLMIHFTLEHS